MPHLVKYPEFADLPPKEKHAAQKKRWNENMKKDPEEAERMRKRNTENKRRSRARQLLQNQRDTGGNLAGDQPPTKRRRVTKSNTTRPFHSSGPSEPSNDAGLSNVLHATPPTLGWSSHTTGPSQSAGLSDPSPNACPSEAPNATESTACVIGPSNVAHDPIPIDPVLLEPHNAESRQYADVSVTTKSHSTRDACVMTELSLSTNKPPIPENEPILSSPSSTLTDLPVAVLHVGNDLASHMLGSEVPKESETVQWSDGSITVVPCIWKGGVNLCQEDANTVKNFAKLPESRPGSEYIEHVHFRDWHSKTAELRELITATLRKNKAIVIREIENPERAMLDVDYLEDHYGVSPYMRVVIHGKLTTFPKILQSHVSHRYRRTYEELFEPIQGRYCRPVH